MIAATVFAMALGTQVAQIQTPKTAPQPAQETFQPYDKDKTTKERHEQCQHEVAGCVDVRSEHCEEVRKRCVSPSEEHTSPPSSRGK